jgi:hypothetical protein
MMLRFNLDVNNGGTPILNFEIEARDSANLGGSFVKISSWDGISQTHTLNALVDTQLIPGVIYDFRIRARNNIAFGVYSDYLRQGFNALPVAPINLRRVEYMCSRS